MAENSSWVRRANDGTGRIEEYLCDFAYAPHKHATYALAITTSGVQYFNYRGTLLRALPGEVIVLHPDELHDGQARQGTPFAYRGMNIDPLVIQEILQGASLPFLASGVTKLPEFVSLAKAMLCDFTRPLDTLEFQDLLYSFAVCLQRATTNSTKHTVANYEAIKLVREYIDDELYSKNSEHNGFNLEHLADIANYSKWQVTRDFRALYGTTPYHYLTLKRLQKARGMIEQGQVLSKVALDCGFSDQSHMHRQFKKCFGLTPKMCIKLSK
ncbi:AraC family transcriptional regulator [Pseudoalteromonas sp. S16_S37]|uniref:AraC family transcriptional regulator n=1 Tax=Pseudoalteromonas sp. S16_S37 TaxID=2720228 RepID=UPI001680BA95|nr:AraC family transcriptional regulator [Pseudoalteromonas sp. S16_S37]MBD1584143.1 AraC family transcriptional regulator [Pseudoalteromonas sp. S16_S37]